MQYLESRSQRVRCQEILARGGTKPEVRNTKAECCQDGIYIMLRVLNERSYLFRRRSADCASPFASALFSRGTWEMENFSARASLRQVQCSE